MARGFARKRGRTWYAYWYDNKGRQRAKAIGTNKKEAEAFVAAMQTEVATGAYRELKKVTFPEYAQQWLQDYASVQVKPSTFLNYSSMINSSLIPYFGNVLLADIQTMDIQRYVAKRLKEGLSGSTVQKALVLLKGMYKQAEEWGYVKVNPALNVKAPKRKFVEMQALTPEEVKVLLDAFDPEWKPFFFTAIFTGMRLGELRAIRWSDIDWNGGVIRVRRSVWHGEFQEPKTRNAIRNIGMSPMLIKVLKEYQETTEGSFDDLIFSTASGGIIDDANLRNRVFQPALEKAGLRKIRIHDLRHTYASLLINQGENLKYIQHQLGHGSITTTVDRYGHLMPDSHKDASVRLDATVFGAA